MNKFNKFVEQFWLVFAIITLIYGLYVCYNMGISAGYNHLFIPAIAFMWWLFRRGMRRRLERNSDQNTHNS